MAYVTRDQVNAKLPAPLLLDALDDDGDGQEDDGVFNAIVATASQEVDGYLAGLFTVPFPDPAPAQVSAAALMFTLDAIYGRRAQGGEDHSANPYRSQVKFWRERLQKIGNRELPLDVSQVKAFTPGAAITENAAVNAQST